MQEQYTTLISVDDLSQRINTPSLIVIDCRYSLTDAQYGRRCFDEAHIPSARFIDLEHELSGAHSAGSGRHPLPKKSDFDRTLCRLGVSSSDQLVVYDDKSGGVCGRFWWMMRWAGHFNVAVLDGGFNAWVEAGKDTTQALASYAPSEFAGDYDDSLWVSTADLEANLDQNVLRILDAREAARYRGEIEPIDPVAGHIPGAISVPLTDNLGRKGCFISASQLKGRFAPIVGETSVRHIVHSCGSGVSACHNLLAMEHAGLTGSKLYVGSWSEWVADENRPVASVME